jgi:pantothenate kinase
VILRISPDGRELPDLLARSPGRLLGISGAPGAGKSTFAAALAALATLRAVEAVVVPMDGFHLADVELRRRGLRERKGAPETFDAEGYAALLARVAAREHLVMAPTYDRGIELPVAGAIPVPAGAGLVVTEGNYLLLETGAWPGVDAVLDGVWHVRVEESLRLERLVARHVRFGKSEAAARDWVHRVDQPNADLVEAAAWRADLVIDLTDWTLADRTPPSPSPSQG